LERNRHKTHVRKRVKKYHRKRRNSKYLLRGEKTFVNGKNAQNAF